MKNKHDWQAAYFNLIADLRENEPEAYKRCRRRIIEKFEAENEAIGGVSMATLQELWDGADWRNGFTEPRIINTNP
jgi:hypothetical protein